MRATRKAGTYLAVVDWKTITYTALASAAMAHYVTPWLLLVVLPLLAQQVAVSWMKGSLVLELTEQREAARASLHSQLEALANGEEKPE